MPADAPALHRHEGSRLSMACVYSIVAYGTDASALPAAVESAFDEVDRIDRLMSHYRPESPLSRINRDAARGPVAVDPELLRFLAECLRWSAWSDGAFDVTVGPLMKAWGFFRGEGHLPDDRALEKAREAVGWPHVELDLDRGTVLFDRPEVELDLGGIAKGYAVDRAVAVLREKGVSSALVSAGGSTVYGLGTPPGRRGWRVGIEDPLRPGRVARRIWLKDRALSVSGVSARWFEVGGKKYSHVMDPRTGRPVSGMLGVAVLCPAGVTGDALDNAFFVLGVEETRRRLAERPSTTVFFFLPAGDRRWRLVRLGG